MPVLDEKLSSEDSLPRRLGSCGLVEAANGPRGTGECLVQPLSVNTTMKKQVRSFALIACMRLESPQTVLENVTVQSARLVRKLS